MCVICFYIILSLLSVMFLIFIVLLILTIFVLFFFNEPATPEIYTYCHTLSLHAALPICWTAGTPGSEMLGDQLFHQLRISVADHDHRRPVRPVPAFVKRAQAFRRRASQGCVSADRVTLGDLETGVEERPALLHHAGGELGSPAFFGEDDAPLRLDGGGIKQRRVDHVGEDVETEVDLLRVGAGKVELIDGLGRAGGRIGVAAEAGAQFLPGLPRLAVAEACRAAERHVLDEVRPPPLMVLLVERAGVDPEPDRDLAGGKRVLPHRIMDAVGERAEGPGLVAWNIAAAIEPVRVAGGMDRPRDEDEKKGEQAAVEEGHRVLASEGETVWKRQMDDRQRVVKGKSVSVSGDLGG